MNYSQAFSTLRKEGFSDDEILDNFKEFSPDYAESVDTLLKEGFSTKEVLSNLEEFQKSTFPKRKAGKAESIVLGAGEAILGIPALIQYGINEYSKALEDEPTDLTYEQENPIGAFLQQLPESEDELSRRLRVGTGGVISGIPFGPAGIAAGLFGSQAGQTVREQFGNEGKFDEFGGGEIAAILVDVLTGGTAGVVTDIARNAPRIAAREVPIAFEEGRNTLQRAAQRATIQGERSALEQQIAGFGEQQLGQFRQEAANLSPNRFQDLTDSSASVLDRAARQANIEGNLRIISPVAETAEQSMTRIQQAANVTFNDEIIPAERAAYTQARQAAQGLSGQAPRTIVEARDLLTDFERVPLEVRTPEQSAVISYLNDLIQTLVEQVPESTILDQFGNPITRATTRNRVLPANDFVELIQRSNQFVQYGSEIREQSHRLIPLLRTLRNEVGQILDQNQAARQAYQAANNLHATNAEIWGTRFMRDVRFTENPENLVGRLKKASNLRNFNLAIQDPNMRSVAERQLVENLISTGNPQSNQQALNQLGNQLSPNARQAANNIINTKDPLTTAGGRVNLRNQILKDAAQAVTSGQRPEKILKLMNTVKGYREVREALRNTPQGRQLFQTLERQFVEDIINSATDSAGRLDFKKARELIKTPEIRAVLNEIGGAPLVNRFTQLERYAQNLERNMSLYKSPTVQNAISDILGTVRNAGMWGAIFHTLHMPTPVIASLGIGTMGIKAMKKVSSIVMDAVLRNPRTFALLEEVTRARSLSALQQSLPRFLQSLNKILTEDEKAIIDSSV